MSRRALSSVLPFLSCRALCSFSQFGDLCAQRQGYPAGLYQGGLGSQLNLQDGVVSGPARCELYLACVRASSALQMVASALEEEVTWLLNHSCCFGSLGHLPPWRESGLEEKRALSQANTVNPPASNSRCSIILQEQEKPSCSAESMYRGPGDSRTFAF